MIRRRFFMSPSGGGGSDVPRDGLIAEWLFENDLKDTSGNQYDLSISATGNGDVDFVSKDGIQSCVYVPTRYLYRDTAFFTGVSTFTISLWYWLQSSSATYPQLLTFARGTSYTDMAIGLGFAGNLANLLYVMAFQNGTGNDSIYALNLETGVWHNAVIQCDGANKTVAIYVDGVLTESKTLSKAPRTDGTSFNINGLNNSTNFAAGNTWYWHTRIYNRVLSQDEILALYQEKE